ncbi:hypothetical protein B0O80DRAFT_454970 [Mortierella sp. GBAus27b]|nr:hypothetical protein B0O80DRAFT_454970 [Mortierella sp. GBAus27b]
MPGLPHTSSSSSSSSSHPHPPFLSPITSLPPQNHPPAIQNQEADSASVADALEDSSSTIVQITSHGHPQPDQPTPTCQDKGKQVDHSLPEEGPEPGPNASPLHGSPPSSLHHDHDDDTAGLPTAVQEPPSLLAVTTAISEDRPHESESPSPQRPPRIPLPPLQAPLFTSADEPPPYSPTHTILPHYFSLEPIPIRMYTIKEATSQPFLYDFWLCSTTQQSSPSRPHSPTFRIQERGISPQRHELKYSICRPQRTDTTAMASSNPSASNAYFLPAQALVAANHPARWIWWGTEALQMVVFGRQQKNIIMEWKWKRSRTRIGGPIVHRLIGCSFRITPERTYCWKLGTGSRRHNTGHDRALQERSRSNFAQSPVSSESSNGAGESSWMGRLVSRFRTAPSTTVASGSNTDSAIPMGQVHISIDPPPVADGEEDTRDNPIENTRLTERDTLTPESNGVDEDDEEMGCYHCREECPSGTTGRIVAVFRPSRPANRARDRPAMSCRLEIFTELGERCETAMMLMCMRLDDLFMSIPAEKRGLFVPMSSSPAQGSSTGGDSQDRTTDPAGGVSVETNDVHNHVVDEQSQTVPVGGRRLGASIRKHILGSRKTWKTRSKWIIAVILIVSVLVLVLKPKLSRKDTGNQR